MDLLSAADAAEKLDVTERQVRRLAASGELSGRRVGGRWLLDAEAVRRRSRSEPRRGRPLSPGMAWTILAIITAVLEADADAGVDEAHAIEDRRDRYRLRTLLANAPPTWDWHQWLRQRADLRRIWVHPGVIDRLADDDRVHASGGAVAASSGLGIAVSPSHTCYVDESVVDEVLSDYRAHRSDEGQVVMMVVPAGTPPEVLGAPGALVNVAGALVDLLASSDARERHAAASALDAARRAFVTSSGRTTSSS